MYSIVLMAALTTGTDMPDLGHRGGGCCGCYGGWGGGGGYGMGWGGGGGCYGGWGGCYGMGMGYGGYRMGWGGGYGGYRVGWGGGYGGYVMGGLSPMIGGLAYPPMISTWGTPLVSTAGASVNPGMTQSFYFRPAAENEATITVHLPAEANLTIDGQPTQSQSSTRVFTSPPLEPGKTYTYTLRAEMNRDGHFVRDTKTVEVRAGKRTEVTMSFGNAKREEEEINTPTPSNRTLPPGSPPPNR